MRERAPLLYETSVVGSARVRPTRFAADMPLSERLLANIDMDRSMVVFLLLLFFFALTNHQPPFLVNARFEAQKQELEHLAEQEDEDDDEDNIDETDEPNKPDPLPSKLGEGDEGDVNMDEDMQETHWRHTQFIKTMERRFLDGMLGNIHCFPIKSLTTVQQVKTRNLLITEQ